MFCTTAFASLLPRNLLKLKTTSPLPLVPPYAFAFIIGALTISYTRFNYKFDIEKENRAKIIVSKFSVDNHRCNVLFICLDFTDFSPDNYERFLQLTKSVTGIGTLKDNADRLTEDYGGDRYSDFANWATPCWWRAPVSGRAWMCAARLCVWW